MLKGRSKQEQQQDMLVFKQKGITQQLIDKYCPDFQEYYKVEFGLKSASRADKLLKHFMRQKIVCRPGDDYKISVKNEKISVQEAIADESSFYTGTS